jgi:outer membrane receptor protein involved in Fe transport
MAAYGELSYDVTDAWSVSVGARYYKYDLKTRSAVDFPLFNGTTDQIILNFEEGGQKDDGWLGKFNTSYKFTDDVMAYFTVSQGYRIGNSNGVGPCPDPVPPNQQLACALPDEMLFLPDKTLNYELGAKTQWLDKRLTLTAALFYIQWEDIQVSSATVNGAIPITKNGQGAESSGVELNFAWDLTDNLNIAGSYSYTKAELTDLAPALIRTIEPPGFSTNPAIFLDGEAGDRLPGSPEQQGSFAVNYQRPIAENVNLELSWNMVAVGDILTRTGGRGGAYKLDGYTLHNARVSLTDPDANWTLTLYADNLFDEYIETNARSTQLFNQTLTDDAGGPVYVRSFYTDVAPPRAIGVRFSKRWGG